MIRKNIIPLSEKIGYIGALGVGLLDLLVTTIFSIKDYVELYNTKLNGGRLISIFDLIFHLSKCVIKILFLLPFALIGGALGAVVVFFTCLFKPDMICIEPNTAPAPVPGDDKSVRIMTFNVSMGLEVINTFSGLSRSTAEAVVLVATNLLESDAQVVCLQECFDIQASRSLSEKLKEKYPYQILNIGPNKFGLNSGLAMFSQFPLEKPRFYKHTTTAGYCRFAKKGTLVSQVNLGKERIVVSNTHLTAFPDYDTPGAAEARIKQMRVWREEFLPDYKKSTNVTQDVLVFQCGDFNSSPQLPCLWPEWPSILGTDQEAQSSETTTMPHGEYAYYDHIFFSCREPGQVHGTIQVADDFFQKLSDHVSVTGCFRWGS
ncbi:MAG: endonuclease/exonuclease/phosphatase family protein [Gammaproteobacteria bacterium]|nr:endonuclease/exonuclease/phosphatase family protein [Gammaproteobacteria bacterium]